MKDLTIKADELKQLLDFVGEVPGKWSTPITNFIVAVTQKRLQEEAEAKTNLKTASNEPKAEPLLQ